MSKYGLLSEVPPHPGFLPLDEDYAQCSVPEYIERVVARHPENLAASDEETTLTYRQLNQQANQLAHHLNSRATSEIIALIVPNSVGLILGFLGILKAGKAVVMIDPETPPDRIRWIVDNADVTCIVTGQANLKLVNSIFDVDILIIDLSQDLQNELENNLENNISPEDSAVLVYTSGSTGTPKGMMHIHRAWMENIGEAAVRNKFSSADRSAQTFSPSSAASVISILVALITGASSHVFDTKKMDMSYFVDWIQIHQITIFRMTSTSFRQILSSSPKPRKLKSIRLAIFGGETIHENDFDLFKQFFPKTAFMRAGGGMSETLLIAACYLNHETVLDRKGMPMGYLANCVQVEIWDTDGHPVPQGVVGELVVTGTTVTRGYWRDTDESDNVFISSTKNPHVTTYLTGDRGYFAEGNLLYILGREDNRVKIRGYRIELGEVESHLVNLSSIAQVCVLAQPVANNNMQLVAYIVANLQEFPSIKSIRDALTHKLPAYMIPARYIFMETLPLNTSGKIDRGALPLPNKLRPELDTPYRSPKSGFEIKLTNIWSEVLGIDEIGIDDNFVMLGGDSLSAAQIFFMIEDELQLKLPPSFLLDAPTIRLIAEKTNHYLEQYSSLLINLKNAAQNRPTLLLFAPIFGDVIIFRDLVNHLPEGYGALGLHSWGVDREEFTALSVDEIIDIYLPLILEQQPDGPYYLGGFSFGGVFAYHTGHRLREMGKRVEFVFMLDTPGPGQMFDKEKLMSLSEHYQNILEMRMFRKRVKYILNDFLKNIPFSVSLGLQSIMGYFQSEINFLFYNPLQTPYMPPRSDTKVLHFRATDNPKRHPEGHTLGWKQIAHGELKSILLQGVHTSYFKGKNAKNIVSVLIDEIES